MLSAITSANSRVHSVVHLGAWTCKRILPSIKESLLYHVSIWYPSLFTRACSPGTCQLNGVTTGFDGSQEPSFFESMVPALVWVLPLSLQARFGPVFLHKPILTSLEHPQVPLSLPSFDHPGTPPGVPHLFPPTSSIPLLGSPFSWGPRAMRHLCPRALTPRSQPVPLQDRLHLPSCFPRLPASPHPSLIPDPLPWDPFWPPISPRPLPLTLHLSPRILLPFRFTG